VAKEFGPGFADALFASAAGAWGGPIPSGYGWHIVRIDALEPSRVPALEEIEADVRAAWTDERYREIRERAAEEMRARYSVVIPPFDPAELVELGAPTASAGDLLQ
jgi:parvulin-like peptidyl-prolyl isomerase